MEKLSDEEWNPFALDDEEDAAPSPALSLTSSPRRKARKRPRSPIKLTPARPVVTTPESGQWANDFAVDEEDEFALSVPRFRRKLETQENGSPWRALQVIIQSQVALSLIFFCLKNVLQVLHFEAHGCFCFCQPYINYCVLVVSGAWGGSPVSTSSLM